MKELIQGKKRMQGLLKGINHQMNTSINDKNERMTEKMERNEERS